MPLQPVTHYEEPAYPTLDDSAEARRAFLRRIGLAAIAAALGPASGCKGIGGIAGGIPANNGSTRNGPTSGNDGPQGNTRTAGVPPPPKWPGPKGALIGGGPIAVTFAGSEKGWVAVAAVFDPSNTKLEDRLIEAETEIKSAVMKRLSREPRSSLKSAALRDAVEADLLLEIRKLAGSQAIESVTLAELTDEAVRGPARRPAAPAGAAAPPPPAAAPSAAPAPAPQRRGLPRAGTSCPLHPEGCEASGKPDTGT